jgi:hypothetical protein
MVKLDLVQALALGAGLGAAYGFGGKAHFPGERSQAVMKGATLGVIAAGVLTLLLREPEEAAHASLPPSTPVVTRGAFAGLPRPLYQASDADRHFHEETGT